ncbi:MAG: methylenetetrahydrofolate reductase [Hyphomicrobiaceae bacterium]|nr:MAG: methylenetetrahydrofolate reductase [Hyphomicrobiaceae bacterium]
MRDTPATDLRQAINSLLRGFSVEITPGDAKSINVAAMALPENTETFVASLPNGRLDDVVETAVRLKQGGLHPVPHLAARNLTSKAQLQDLLARLAGEAGVERALVIGGDRPEPSGPYEQSLQILNSGLLQKHGVRTVYLSCYPEGHPRITNDQLRSARRQKLAAAKEAGFNVGFVSQFCFESAPIIQMARELRQEDIDDHLRIGLAGPTGPATLIKYAAICGVGPSIRAIRERQSLARNMMASNAEELVVEIASAQRSQPTLGLQGVHFFTFGALARTAQLIARIRLWEP